MQPGGKISEASGSHFRPDLAGRIGRILQLVTPDEPLQLMFASAPPVPRFCAVEQFADHRKRKHQRALPEVGRVSRTPNGITIEQEGDNVGIDNYTTHAARSDLS